MLTNDAIFNVQSLPANPGGKIYDSNEHIRTEHDDIADYCYNCTAIYDYNKLTHEMVEEIKYLRAEVVRWRQVLSKHLSPDWADGLRQDIFDNIFQNFEDFDAYKAFVRNCCNGTDPLENDEQSAFLNRLKDGTDETSITYL